MKAIQIFNKYNGQPKLLEYNEDEGYRYDDRYYTHIAPPDGIYTPCEFVDGKWQSLSDEPEKVLNEEVVEEVPKKEDDVMASLLIQQVENEQKIKEIEEMNSLLMLKLAGGNPDVL